MTNKMILSLSYVQKPLGVDDIPRKEIFCPATITTVLDSELGFESVKDEENLRTIFGLLHDPVMSRHRRDVAAMKMSARMTPADFCEYCLEQDDTLLLKLLYSFSTGKMSFTPTELSKNLDRRSKNLLSEYLAISVAKCMIERVNTDMPGPLQLMIGDVLSLANAPNETKSFMSKMRLSAGRRTMDRSNLKHALQDALDKLNLEPLDGFCLHLDNFGFKGKKAQYSQHTVVQIARIKSGLLRSLGFYDDYKISRLGRSFEELLHQFDDESPNDEMKHDALAESIVAPNEQDYSLLSSRILTTLETAIHLSLPTPEECRELLESNDSLRWPHELPANLGVQLKTNQNIQRPTLEYSLDPIFANADFEDDNPPATFYELNDITLDHVLHGDPGSCAVVEKIVKYLEQASLVDEDTYSFEESGGEAPVRGIVAPATGDGAPTKRWLDFQASDIAEEGSFDGRKYTKSRFFLGGMHYMMEFMTMRARLSRDYISYFVRKWRPTDPQLNWIMVIRDPKEALQEWREYLLAHYRCAADASGKSNPFEVHEYMIERAVDVPMCMAALLDLRLLEIGFMIRDSEKAGTHGDFDMFLTSMRFSLPLFTISHATNYCHIVCDFLEWNELASEAEKVLFKNFYYTKLSPNGKPIWVDRGVEWTVRHIRTFLGHRVRPRNHDQVVERVVSEIPFRIRAKADLRYLLGTENAEDYTTKNWNDQTFRLSKAYLTTRIALDDTNFWGPGLLQGDLSCNTSNGIVLADNGGELAMSSSYLGGFDLGVERAKAYFIEHHVRRRYPTKRSEGIVSLKLLPTTHDQRVRDLEKTRTVRLSVEPRELEPMRSEFPKEKILEELNHFREYCFPEMPEYKISEGRPELVRVFCKYRKRYFELYPEVYQETKEATEQLDRSDRATNQNSRIQQIKSPIYSLTEEAKERFR
jgi:hypothetical protein